MLPHRLYELLPYLYILTGVVSALLIDSLLIMISSMLMIMAGVIVFTMRYSSRRGLQKSGTAVQGERRPHAFVERAREDRRGSVASRFPLVDSTGMRIDSDRRRGERRLSTA